MMPNPFSSRDLLPVTHQRALGFLAFLFVLWLAMAPLPPAQAQEPIQVGEPQVINEFPERLVVRFPLQSRGADIVEVRGRLRLGVRPVYQRITLEVAPGREATATWVWDTSRITVPPYVPLEIQLEVRDAQEQRLRTGPFFLVYEDNRFDWRERRSEHLIVRWYEGSDAFGENIFRLAQESLERQMEALGIVPERPLVLLVYANQEDFFAWHSYRTEWIGGQAFPEYGVAAQIIPPGSQPDWVRDVIPHEINHLLVSPYVSTPLGTVPPWLEEGLAQYFELSPAFDERYRLQQAVKEGRVLPLGIMRSPAGQDEKEAKLWYAQALGMVEYLIERHGTEGLQRYMRLLHEGRPASKAFVEAFGESEDAFYAQWLRAVGAPTPTPTPTPSFTPTPSPTAVPTLVATPTLTPTAGERAFSSLTATPTPEVVLASREVEVVGGDSRLTTRTPYPTTTPRPPAPLTTWLGALSVLAGIGVLLMTILLLFRARR